MTLKELYFRVRPMAAHRPKQRVTVPPVAWFAIAAAASTVGGLFSGFLMWLGAGFNPDNSGGSVIFVLGSVAMSSLAVILALFWKNRAVFYGLNTFTIATVLLILLSILSGEWSWSDAEESDIHTVTKNLGSPHS